MDTEKIISSRELQQIADFKLRGRGVGNTTLIIQNILALYRMKIKCDVFVYISEEDSNYSSMSDLKSSLEYHKIEYKSQKQTAVIVGKMKIKFDKIDFYNELTKKRIEYRNQLHNDVIIMFDPAELALRFEEK